MFHILDITLQENERGFNKMEKIREFTQELDHVSGEFAINLNTLGNLSKELGNIALDVREADVMNVMQAAMVFYDIRHKIELLADLMYYTLGDLEDTYEKSFKTTSDLFNHVREKPTAKTAD